MKSKISKTTILHLSLLIIAAIIGSPLVSAAPAWNQYLNQSIVGYYAFELSSNATGTVIPNLVNSTANMKLGAGNLFEPGKIGNAYRALPIGGSVDSNSTMIMPVNNSDWTVSFWVYNLDDTITGASIAYWGADVCGTGTNGELIMLEIHRNLTRIWAADASSDSIAEFPIETWTHEVVIYNGTAFNFYQNGVFANGVNKDLNIGNSVNLTFSPNWERQCGGQNLFNGRIDEFAIWNRTLNDTEISFLYNSGSGLAYNSNGAALTATQSYPMNNYNSSSKTVNIGCNFTSVNQNISSVKLNVYNSSNYLSYTNTISSLTTTSYNATWTTSSINDGNYSWECFGYGNSNINGSTGNRTLTIDTISPSISVVYPTSNLLINFSNYPMNTSLNFTVNDPALQTCWYTQDNGVTNQTLASCQNSTINLTVVGPNTIKVYANDSLGHSNYSSIIFYTFPYFQFCNASVNLPFLNISFFDEATLSKINGSISSSTWSYYPSLIPPSFNSSFIFYNNTGNPSYLFCAFPNSSQIVTDYTIQYSSTDGGTYPQRRAAVNGLALTNITTNLSLPLLKSTDGIYSSIMTANSMGVGLVGIQVTITAVINGVTYTMGNDVSDSAGVVTFFVNPNQVYTITATSPTEGTTTATWKPSQSTYTLQIGGSSTIRPDSGFTWQGITYKTYPPAGLLYQFQIYTFMLNVTSASSGNLQACKLEIRDQNGNVVASAIGCNTSLYSGLAYTSLNVSNYSKLFGYYYMDLGGGYQFVKANDAWVIDINYYNSTNYNFWRFINLFENESSYSRTIFGDTHNQQEFSLIVISFFGIAILFAALNRFTGFDLKSPGAAIGLVFSIITLLSIAGFLQIRGLSLTSGIDKYAITIIAGTFGAGYLLNRFRRENG